MNPLIYAIPSFILILIALIVFLLVFRVNGSGNMITEKRLLNGFKNITIQAGGQIIIRQVDEYLFTIEADDNIHPYIKTILDKDNLIIKITRLLPTLKKSNIIINTPDINKLELIGVGNIKIENAFKTDRMMIENKGPGTIFGKIQANELMFHNSGKGSIIIEAFCNEILSSVNGIGTIQLSGTTNRHSINTQSTGSIEAFNLQTKQTHIISSGMGKSEVTVKDRLEVRIHGSGSVDYNGDPKLISNIHGTGKVTKRIS